MPGGSNPPGTPTTITTVDGATVTFTSGAEGNIWNSQFIGSVTTTNRYTQPQSAGGTTSFQNFLGVAQIALNAGNFRFFNDSGVSGGNSTRFEFIGGNVHVRGSGIPGQIQTVFLGEVAGGSSACGIGGPGTAGAVTSWIIGGKNVDCAFEGYLNGATNNLIKTGSARLTLDGVAVTTNTDLATFTNYLYSSLITYPGTTTVSNGVLALVVPNTLSNSPLITLSASTAVLDASRMGYVSNFTDVNGANSVLVTDGSFALQNAQTLQGIGTVIASNVTADATTTIAPGLPTNTFGNLIILGKLVSDGAINLKAGHTTSAVSDKLTSTNMTLNGSITVTQAGANDLVTGDVFTLFSGPVSGNATNSVTLPAQNPSATISYVWTNKLSINGTIVLLSGASPVNTNPTNITVSLSGNQLTLSWPADHTGWRLQAQTNSVSVGLTPNWFDVPGSTTVNSMTFTLNPANGTVFYRMIYP
jgi:hypothetical protein